MSVAKPHWLVHKKGDCIGVENDQVDKHYLMTLIYILVRAEQAADGNQSSGDHPGIRKAKNFIQNIFPKPEVLVIQVACKKR